MLPRNKDNSLININLDPMPYFIYLEIINSASHNQSLHHATSDQNLCRVSFKSIIQLQLLSVSSI